MYTTEDDSEIVLDEEWTLNVVHDVLRDHVELHDARRAAMVKLLHGSGIDAKVCRDIAVLAKSPGDIEVCSDLGGTRTVCMREWGLRVVASPSDEIYILAWFGQISGDPIRRMPGLEELVFRAIACA